MQKQNRVPQASQSQFRSDQTWRKIAEEASRECDGRGLLELTEELLAALDRNLADGRPILCGS